MLIREYLEQRGYFHAPREEGYHPTTSDVSEQDVIRLEPEWIPEAARFDPSMVDTLICVFNDSVGDAEVPREVGENYFESMRLGQQSKPKIENESDVRTLSYSFLHAMFFINTCLERRIVIQEEGETAQPRVDIVIEGHPQKRSLLELKNPTIVAEVIKLLRMSIKMELKAGAKTPGRKVMNKLAVCMASHHTQWAALSCHNRWIFFRLHKATGGNNAYLSFSSVASLRPNTSEDTSSRTRPLRAFLGMLVATACDVEVVSGANLQERLESAPEDEYENAENRYNNNNGDSRDNTTRDGTSDGLTGTPAEDASKRPAGSRASRHRKRCGVPDILISWSLEIRRVPSGFQTFSISTPETYRSGINGCIYEAKVTDSAEEPRPEGPAYAVKMVSKGGVGPEKERVTRLLKEARFYATIEEARQRGRALKAVPCCYGLYETNHTVALVLDYAGDSLSGVEWQQLDAHERESIFETVKEIHELGISHEDFDPRNVQANSTVVEELEGRTV